MTLWIDAQLSPALAHWIETTYGVAAIAIRDLGLRGATDIEIFQAARAAEAVVMTKDSDFVELLDRLGPPPQVLWITCGNTSNARLRIILSTAFAVAQSLIDQGEPLVEIADSP
jgi:predicted nuclease of predicted toxin-antitoxin system